MSFTQVTAANWLRCFHPRPGARLRLVCFPHAGGGASAFYGLSAAVADHIEVHAVQYPGRQDRLTEPLISNITGLADELAAVLAGRHDKPTGLFGHSMGATVAFEVARQMADQPPVALLASARIAPSTAETRWRTITDDDSLLAEMAFLSGKDPALLYDQRLLEFVLPALRNDYAAVNTYRYSPGPALTCPITVLLGDEDPVLGVREAERWSEHTSGAFSVKVFPGGHFYFTDQPEAVAAFISNSL